MIDIGKRKNKKIKKYNFIAPLGLSISYISIFNLSLIEVEIESHIQNEVPFLFGRLLYNSTANSLVKGYKNKR